MLCGWIISRRMLVWMDGWNLSFQPSVHSSAHHPPTTFPYMFLSITFHVDYLLLLCFSVSRSRRETHALQLSLDYGWTCFVEFSRSMPCDTLNSVLKVLMRTGQQSNNVTQKCNVLSDLGGLYDRLQYHPKVGSCSQICSRRVCLFRYSVGISGTCGSQTDAGE